MDAKPSVRKQILRELHITHSCNSRYIVSSFGAYILEPNICICMEYMDKGSFDGIYKRMGAIPIDMVGMVAANVLEGLVYLYDVHHIMHRGMLPSTVGFLYLLNLYRHQTLEHFTQLRRGDQAM